MNDTEAKGALTQFCFIRDVASRLPWTQEQ
jgi:hypothetical protein